MKKSELKTIIKEVVTEELAKISAKSKFWVEIDGQDIWKAEDILKTKKIQYMLKNKVFYFSSEEDKSKAFKAFNAKKLIIY